jgi:hypothetical protein
MKNAWILAAMLIGCSNDVAKDLDRAGDDGASDTGFDDAGTPSDSDASPVNDTDDDTDTPDDDSDTPDHDSDTPDDDTDAPETDEEIDGDSDGYTIENGDCDDRNPMTYPRAVERCDGVDNNCNGTVDEDAIDASFWFIDADADGFGSRSSSVLTCEAPAGYVTSGSDCDDTSDTTYPGAPELCDDIDNACDGGTDEGTATWYSSAGSITDLSSVLDMGSSYPATVILPDSGLLMLCENWWPAHLVLQGEEVTIQGAGERDNIILFAGDSGRAVTAESTLTQLTIRNVTLMNGYAYDADGGLVYAADADVLLEDVRMREGWANNGGAVAVAGGSLTIEDSVIEANVATTNGGGISITDGDLVVTNSSIVDNMAYIDGGGLYADSWVEITASTIDANVAYNDGGGARVTGEGISVVGSSVNDNDADNHGGGLSIVSDQNVAVELSNTGLAGNNATYRGAAVHIEGTSTLSNLEFTCEDGAGASELVDNNSVAGAALWLSTPGHWELTSDYCDWGEYSTGDDNIGIDIASLSGWGDPGNNALFICDDEFGCSGGIFWMPF